MIRIKFVALLLCLPLLLTGCQALTAPDAGATDASSMENSADGVEGGTRPTLVLASHDSFSVSEDVVAEFEAANNATVQFLALGDAGEALTKIILSKDAPLADLFFGVDNTFLSRALAAQVFAPYAAPALADIPTELQLDSAQSLVPVDYGYVNLNADAGWFEAQNLPLPASLEDLTKPEYAGLLVVPNPATSSPGLAFLLATIGHYGEAEALDFWSALRENDVLVTDGWSEAYFEHFTVGSGGLGDRPLVVSYSSSPPADVLYATDGRTEPASVNLNLPGGVFRQIEFAGILAGTEQRDLAEKWIDFMLSPAFQEDMPLQMFVYPVLPTAELPELFTAFAAPVEDPVDVDPAAIDANREQWIDAWTNVMLR